MQVIGKLVCYAVYFLQKIVFVTVSHLFPFFLSIFSQVIGKLVFLKILLMLFQKLNEVRISCTMWVIYMQVIGKLVCYAGYW